MPPTVPRMLLLDSASLYFRAFFGVPEVIGPSGVPTNAVRGLLDMIASLVERGRPTHLVACWDNDWRPAFRVEAIPSYKAHRVAEPGGDELAGESVPEALDVQVPIIIEALTALGIARVGIDDWEKHVVQDPRFFRPAEVDLLIGDPTKARSTLGWAPTVDFAGLVTMMVDSDVLAVNVLTAERS